MPHICLLDHVAEGLGLKLVSHPTAVFAVAGASELLIELATAAPSKLIAKLAEAGGGGAEAGGQGATLVSATGGGRRHSVRVRFRRPWRYTLSVYAGPAVEVEAAGKRPVEEEGEQEGEGTAETKGMLWLGVEYTIDVSGVGLDDSNQFPIQMAGFGQHENLVVVAPTRRHLRTGTMQTFDVQLPGAVAAALSPAGGGAWSHLDCGGQDRFVGSHPAPAGRWTLLAWSPPAGADPSPQCGDPVPEDAAFQAVLEWEGGKRAGVSHAPLLFCHQCFAISDKQWIGCAGSVQGRPARGCRRVPHLTATRPGSVRRRLVSGCSGRPGCTRSLSSVQPSAPMVKRTHLPVATVSSCFLPCSQQIDLGSWPWFSGELPELEIRTAEPVFLSVRVVATVAGGGAEEESVPLQTLLMRSEGGLRHRARVRLPAGRTGRKLQVFAGPADGGAGVGLGLVVEYTVDDAAAGGASSFPLAFVGWERNCAECRIDRPLSGRVLAGVVHGVELELPSTAGDAVAVVSGARWQHLHKVVPPTCPSRPFLFEKTYRRQTCPVGGWFRWRPRRLLRSASRRREKRLCGGLGASRAQLGTRPPSWCVRQGLQVSRSCWLSCLSMSSRHACFIFKTSARSWTATAE